MGKGRYIKGRVLSSGFFFWICMIVNYVIDASAIINGYPLNKGDNFTVAEVICEIKDFKSKIRLDEAICDGKIQIVTPSDESIENLEKKLLKSGDGLRLSQPDKMVIALALDFKGKGKKVKVVTDDYTIQNELKINNIDYLGVLTEGIYDIYNWIKICYGCKKVYPQDYPFDDCEVCGSRVYKKRIKKNR